MPRWMHGRRAKKSKHVRLWPIADIPTTPRYDGYAKRDAPMAVREWLPAPARAAGIHHKLKAGKPLFRLGDKTVGLCEVITGRVRMARIDRSGREIVLHVAAPGETLAEASLFSSQYHCDAIANTDAI